MEAENLTKNQQYMKIFNMDIDLHASYPEGKLEKVTPSLCLKIAKILGKFL